MTADKQLPMSFTGTGGEFFRIWIVNIALTLVTFGIYAAWAKVRTKRWFYGHTHLDEQTFSYHATPMQILKGRLMAMAYMAVYFAASQFAPLLSLIMLAIIYLAMPWIIAQSLKFNAQNSSYRGIRFQFKGSIRDSYINFLLFPLLALLTLGLAFPYVIYRQTRFVLDHYQYGQTPNQFNASSTLFWKIYGAAFALLLIPLLLISIGVSLTLQSSSGGLFSPGFIEAAIQLLTASIFAYYLSIVLLAAFIKANIANIIYNHSRMNDVSFVSNQRARDIAWIYVSNLILMSLTLGLFTPWAKVRLAKYRTEHLLIKSNKNLEDFAAGSNQKVNAAGDEMADVLDMDFGLVG